MSTSTSFALPTIFTGDEARGKHTMRVGQMSKYRPTLLEFLKTKALDLACELQLGSWFFNLFFKERGFESHDRLSAPTEGFILLSTSAENGYLAMFGGEMHLCERVEDDDDHPESVDAAELHSVEEPIDVSAVNIVEDVAALAKKGKKTTQAFCPEEDTKTRLRRLYNERQEAKKRRHWLELKATVETAATHNVPAHVSTTQWHFWNAVFLDAVFLDVLPSFPAPERAARLLALESRDVTDETPKPWSGIWQTYQCVRDIGEIKTSGRDKTLCEFSENHKDFTEKLVDLGLATHMALGLSVALPPVRTVNAPVLAEPTPPEPSASVIPVVNTAAHRTKFLPKSKTTRANFGLAHFAEKTMPASDVAAPPAPPPVLASTNIFGLPLSVPQQSLPSFSGFTFTAPASKTASAHPTSVLLQSTSAVKSPETSRFDFGFAKSTFDAPGGSYTPNIDEPTPAVRFPDTPRFDFGFGKSAFDAPGTSSTPKFNGPTVLGTGITPQTPESPSIEQVPEPAAPTGNKTKSLSAVFGASSINPNSSSAAKPNIFAHLAEQTPEFDSEESGDEDEDEIQPTIETTPMFQKFRASLDKVIEECAKRNSEHSLNVDESQRSSETTSASSITRTPSLTHSPTSEDELAIDSEMAEDYMLDGYGRPLELTGLPPNDKKFLEAVHTKIIAEADQYDFEWAEVDILLAPRDEEEDDDDDDYAVSTVDASGKPIKLTLDVQFLEDDWAQGILSQVFLEFEEVESKLLDVAPQLQVEVTSFLDMFDFEYTSESLELPDDTSPEATELQGVQKIDALMSSFRAICANQLELLHEMYPQAVAVGTRAEVKGADIRMGSSVIRKVAFKAVPAKGPGPQDDLRASSPLNDKSATAPTMSFNRHRPVHPLPHSDRAVHRWLGTHPDNTSTGIGTNELGEPVAFDVSEP